MLRTPSLSSSTCAETEPLRKSDKAVLQAECPSRRPTISVEALKETQSTDPNHWPGLIFSSSATGLSMEEVLLLLCPLSNSTTPQPFCGPFSGTTPVSRRQKRTSGLYDARED